VLGSASSYSAGLNPFDIRNTNYGRLSYDFTNVMVINYIYQLPKLPKGNSFDNAVTRLFLNDWQVSGITTFQTGSPQNISYSISGVSSAVLNRTITGLESVAPRPVLTANPTLSKGDRTMYEYYNTSVVKMALKGQPGRRFQPQHLHWSRGQQFRRFHIQERAVYQGGGPFPPVAVRDVQLPQSHPVQRTQ